MPFAPPQTVHPRKVWLLIDFDTSGQKVAKTQATKLGVCTIARPDVL
jgi:5S rRNA maturation endonuclease (ribonuclease M5)